MAEVIADWRGWAGDRMIIKLIALERPQHVQSMMKMG